MNKKKSIEELNENYFITLANSRGSISSLFISSVGLIIALINIYPSYIINATTDKINPWSNNLNIWLAIVALLLLILFFFSVFNKILYKKQVFGETLVLFMIILTFFSIIYMFYAIAVFTTYSLNLNSVKSYVFIVTITLLSIASIIYNIFWLKKQIKEGFKEERAQKNLLAKAAVYNSESLWIIFGVISVSVIILGQMSFIIGFSAGIFMAIVFSRLIVEIGYLIYLKSKDKVYWEEPPVPKKLSIEEQKKRRSKIIKIVNIIMSIGLLFLIEWILENFEVEGSLKTIIKIIIIVVILNLLAILLLWIIKKIKKHLRKEQ